MAIVRLYRKISVAAFNTALMADKTLKIKKTIRPAVLKLC